MTHAESNPQNRPLRLGWIPYWNLRPLRRELEKVAGGSIEVKVGTPAMVNKWLSQGVVDLAPSSSVCLLEATGHDLAFPLGVASEGPVGSVYIGLHHEDNELLGTIRRRQKTLKALMTQAKQRHGHDPRKMAGMVWDMAAEIPETEKVAAPPPLKVTPASETSAALSRIFYRLWFGPDAYRAWASESQNASANIAMSTKRPIELLIGDEALIRRSEFSRVLDLGELWNEMTGYPFVYAVWQSSRALPPGWRQVVLQAAELAQAKMRIDPAVYLPDSPVKDAAGHTIDLAAYWKGIQYRLGTNHFRGLALYLNLVRCQKPQGLDDSALAKLMRWEALGDSSNYASL